MPNLKDLAIAFLAVLLSATGVLYFFERESHHATQVKFESYKTERLQLAKNQEMAYRKLESDFAAFRATKVDALSADLERLRDLADSSKRTSDRLQQLVNRTAARCSAGATSAATGASQAGTDPGVLLADMHREFTARAEALAGYADRGRKRHEACAAIADNEK